MINVTKSVLPPLEEYVGHLEKIWQRGHLTNNGPCLQELEKALAREFGVKHVLLVSNATLALQLAIKALGLKGEVLTTPFSFVATASSIAWEGCDVRFADIDPDTLCLSPEQIKKQMHEGVAAIIPTHVFGNCCDVKEIAKIANAWNVPVIYDAAHAYGVEINGKSIMQFGDISVLSLHATKLFHCVEGGVIATDDDELAHKLTYMRNFGFDGPEAFQGLGTNAKMSEFHAAMGLCLLPKMPIIIAQRQQRVDWYNQAFAKQDKITQPVWVKEASRNAAYYPILLPSESVVHAVIAGLLEQGVSARRYFYPSLTQLPYVVSQNAPASEDVSKRVLCLPLYPDLCLEDVHSIARGVLAALSC